MRQLLVVIALTILATNASAQEATTDARAQARQHFQRAVALFGESQFPEALIEFEAAYSAVPNHRVLFNIGNVHAALGNAVEAVDAYERYLAEGGATIGARRRGDVQAALDAQRTRIGAVTIASNVEGATVVVDGVDTAHTTPMSAPLRLSIGRYSIGLRLSGHEGATLPVTVAGQSEQTVRIEMNRIVASRGLLRVRATAPDVEVRVDGEMVGTTPIDEELVVDPGEREVVGQREGYVTTRERVTVAEGATVDVDLRMARDPDAPAAALGVLSLALPDADATLHVDGETIAMDGGRVTLPAGAHEIRLEVDERQALRQTVEVPAGGELTLSPRLMWTDAARGTRVNRASNYRTIGWVLGIAGVVATGVSTGVLIWAQSEIDAYDDLIALVMGPGGCREDPERGLDCDMVHGDGTNDSLAETTGGAEVFQLGSAIGLGLGVAATAIGITLLVLSDSDEDIDAAASAPTASLRVGPGSVTLYGSF